MALKPARRNYNCSDANLKAAADQIANCATRDIADFATYDVDADDITAFQTTITTFADKTTDDESLGDQKTETDNKNALRKDIEDAIRLIRTAAQLQYGGQGNYRKFGFDGLTELSDNNLVRMARRVIRVLTALTADMETSFPSVNDKITALTTKVNDFDDAVDQIIDKKNDRDIATQDRIVAGNAVYAGVYKLSTIGKTLYQDTNEAKYNDYVLNFQGASPENPVPGKLEGTITDIATGSPIAGATVSILDETYSTTSDAQGKYSLAIPVPGSYIPIFRAEGYNDYYIGAFDVKAGKSTTVDATLPKTVTAMVGTITDAATGLPIKDVTIISYSLDATVYSDAQGNYKYPISAAGTYTFNASKSGYYSVQSPTLENIAIADGQILTKNFTMTLIPPAS